MRLKFPVGMILILLLFWTAPAVAESDIQEGLWEITLRMEMPGVPANQMKPVASTHCLKHRQQVPQLLQQEHTCQILKTNMEGDSLSWTMKCHSGEGSIDGSGKMTYRGSRFEGVIHLTMRQPNLSPMKITQYVSGKRLGNCP